MKGPQIDSWILLFAALVVAATLLTGWIILFHKFG